MLVGTKIRSFPRRLQPRAQIFINKRSSFRARGSVHLSRARGRSDRREGKKGSINLWKKKETDRESIRLLISSTDPFFFSSRAERKHNLGFTHWQHLS